jgi:hypothetical protein
VAVSVSHDLHDPIWDQYLAFNPLGQYQQCTFWAEAKEPQGWKRLRIALSRDDRICSGFQILTKDSNFGRVGYLSKGPVCRDNDPAALNQLTSVLIACVRRFRMRALICQPPDDSVGFAELLQERGFRPFLQYLVNEATLIADLGGGPVRLESMINATARNRIRQAKRKGVTIREGGRSDLPTFFRLMLHSCERQAVSPNPASLEDLTHYWDALHSAGSARLSFAEYEGAPVAGAFCIAFGQRCTLRKKGWNGLHGDKSPNDLLLYEAMMWAQERGLTSFDFGDVDRALAEEMLSGRELTQDQRKSPHLFHLRFGGVPRLLPRATIYINGAVSRLVYEMGIRTRLVRDRIDRRFA